MHLVCYLRAGDRVFETYWTTIRGVEVMDYSYALVDLTVYGRQETWKDSPPGWPQQWQVDPNNKDALTTSPLGPDRQWRGRLVNARAASTKCPVSRSSRIPRSPSPVRERLFELRSRSHSRTASFTTPTPPTNARSTSSGACTSGSTARHSGATRPASGGAATTSTQASEREFRTAGADPGRRRERRRAYDIGPTTSPVTVMMSSIKFQWAAQRERARR
jgi:Bacterial protein of unknown function (DUF899)